MRTALAAMALLAFTTDADAKKPKGPSGPVVGWHQEAGWTGACWYPQDFSVLAEGPKRVAWQETRDAILAQWRGERGDGVTLREQAVTDLETVMLSKTERVETVARENLEQCKTAMSSGGDTTAWEKWLIEIAGRLTQGECPYAPLDYTAFNYLNINMAWQNRLPVCRGDKIVVHGTEGDYYQIQAGGPFINVAGDPAQKATSTLPCNIEGCLKGQLVMKFTSDSHVSQVIPVGIGVEFLAPEHGQIEVMINDDDLTDNKFKVEKGLEHHTGIEVKPAGG
jgi:hypothetical protein